MGQGSISARRAKSSTGRSRRSTTLPVEQLEGRLLLSATLTTLISFNNTDGANPTGGLTADSAGNLYGTTYQGGSSFQGTLYKLAAGTHVLTTLASFNDSAGIEPRGTPAIDSAGNIFGSASSGGASTYGTVFEYSAGGTLSALASFYNVNGSNPVLDGAFPQAGVTADSQGNIYGLTVQGGANAVGTLYKTNSGGAIIPLIQFNGTNGRSPRGDLVNVGGVLYGTTTNGGLSDLGTVFSFNPTTSAYAKLAEFNGTNGSDPKGGVVFDSAGNLYGTTSGGGSSDDGTVFEVSNTGALTTLATFTGSNGSQPLNDLSIDSHGNLYGTTSTGGTSGYGTVFEIDAATHTLNTLISFTGANGIGPQGNLYMDSSGNLFGTTLDGGTNNQGTVFELTNINAANVLVFTAQPSATQVGGTITPAVQVSEEDPSGTVLTAGSGSVTLSIATGPTTTLGGTLTEPLVNGVATFSDLSISTVGGYTLSATDGTDTAATTHAFSINAAPALVPVTGKSTVPSSVVTGMKINKQITLTLTNATGALLKGAAKVKLFASSDGIIDAGSTLITTISPKVNLKPGKKLLVHIPVKSLPGTLANGTYTLLTQSIDSVGDVNNASAGPSVQAAAPFVQLSDVIGGVSPSTLKAGKSAVLSISILNTGNVPTTGSAMLNIGTSADGQTETTMWLKAPENLKIKNGKSVKLKVHFVVPANTTSGSYPSFISVTQNGSTTSAIGQLNFIVG